MPLGITNADPHTHLLNRGYSFTKCSTQKADTIFEGYFTGGNLFQIFMKQWMQLFIQLVQLGDSRRNFQIDNLLVADIIQILD